jgi:hypothetical protein
MRHSTLALPALLASLAALLVACADSPTYAVQSDAPATPIAFDALTVDGASAPIATDGVQVISIPDPLSVGWSGSASSGFDVEPFGDVWPNTRKPEYRVRALGAGAGTFSIQTEHGVASGEVASTEVDRIAATLVSPHVVEIALYAHDGRRLIDGSLAVHDETDANAIRTAWDRLSIGAPPGTHTLVVDADSFAERRVTITIQ